MIDRIKRKLADKRTYEAAIAMLSMLGAVLQPQHWGMILWGGFVVISVVELLAPDAYDSELYIVFSEDNSQTRSMDTLG